MSTLAFLLSFLLGFATFLGLIAPKLFIKLTKTPSRKKVMLMLGLPAFAMFMVFGQLYQSPIEEALNNPQGTLNLRLSNSKLEAIPKEVYELINLKSLNISKNSIASLTSDLLVLAELESIDLSDNPIDSIPGWLGELENLAELDLTNTQLVHLPTGIGHVNIKYEGTPLWELDHPKEPVSNDLSTNTVSEPTDDNHTESFGEFAFRSLLGNDYGHKRKFGAGEVYYDDPVTKLQADNVGEALTTLGLFNNEKSVSVLLDWDGEAYVLKMVVDEDKELDEEVIEVFQTVRALIETTAFPEDKLSLHLTNGRFETIKTIN